jgi:hypothetical protein
MTRKPGGVRGAAKAEEGAPGIWRVARAGSKGAISANLLAPRARIAKNVASGHDAIAPGR